MDGDYEQVKLRADHRPQKRRKKKHAATWRDNAAVKACPTNSIAKSKRPSGIDRISSLADELLIHILSFLPTNEAIVTSILSRRWRHVYNWIPNLEFDTLPINESLHYPEILACFVTHVKKVLRTNQCNDLTKFHLTIGLPEQSSSYHSTPDLKPTLLRKWIRYSLLHRVKELDLRINVREKLELPKKVFSCKTLEVLNLDCKDLDVQLPKKFCLPKLKVCKFKSINFPKGGFLRKLISGCPSVEDLTMRHCSGWRDLETIYISSPSLRILIVGISPVNIVKGIGIRYDHYTRSKVVLKTPNLEHLEYVDHLAQYYSIGNLNALVKASIDISREQHGGFESMLNLIRPISDVRFLTLKGSWLKLPKDVGVQGKLPVFRNLEHLEFTLHDRRNWRKELLEILSCSPLLETLTLAAWDSFGSGHDESSWGTAKETPSCLRFNLKKIVIGKGWDFGGKLEMVAYFLKNASVLQELEVAAYDNEGWSENALKKLPRASLKCLIKVPIHEFPNNRRRGRVRVRWA